MISIFFHRINLKRPNNKLNKLGLHNTLLDKDINVANIQTTIDTPETKEECGGIQKNKYSINVEIIKQKYKLIFLGRGKLFYT